MKKNKHGTYSRDGIDIEVVANRDDTYEDVLEKARAGLDMAKQKEGFQLSLFTCGGAVMVNREGWTLGGYLQQTHRSSLQTRFGIGFVQVSISLVFVPLWLSICLCMYMYMYMYMYSVPRKRCPQVRN